MFQVMIAKYTLMNTYNLSKTEFNWMRRGKLKHTLFNLLLQINLQNCSLPTKT